MDKEVILYRGKPLTDYTKEELIEIIRELNDIRQRDQVQHSRDLNMLVPPRKEGT